MGVLIHTSRSAGAESRPSGQQLPGASAPMPEEVFWSPGGLKREATSREGIPRSSGQGLGYDTSHMHSTMTTVHWHDVSQGEQSKGGWVCVGGRGCRTP